MTLSFWVSHVYAGSHLNYPANVFVDSNWAEARFSFIAWRTDTFKPGMLTLIVASYMRTGLIPYNLSGLYWLLLNRSHRLLQSL